MEVENSRVAFSQPTETGGYFAKSWSEGSASGADNAKAQKRGKLLVYVEE